jgi:hypothetical protein
MICEDEAGPEETVLPQKLLSLIPTSRRLQEDSAKVFWAVSRRMASLSEHLVALSSGVLALRQLTELGEPYITTKIIGSPGTLTGPADRGRCRESG